MSGVYQYVRNKNYGMSCIYDISKSSKLYCRNKLKELLPYLNFRRSLNQLRRLEVMPSYIALSSEKDKSKWNYD